MVLPLLCCMRGHLGPSLGLGDITPSGVHLIPPIPAWAWESWPAWDCLDAAAAE